MYDLLLGWGRHQLAKLQDLQHHRKAQLEGLKLCQKIRDFMLFETPFEFLHRSRANRPIFPPASDLVKHEFDLSKDLLAFIGNLPGSLFSLGGMYGVRSLQCLSDLFEH